MALGEWLHVAFNPTPTSPAPCIVATCSHDEICLRGILMCCSERWKEKLGHDHAQMVKELMGSGGNQGLYLVSLPGRDSTQK